MFETQEARAGSPPSTCRRRREGDRSASRGRRREAHRRARPDANSARARSSAVSELRGTISGSWTTRIGARPSSRTGVQRRYPDAKPIPRGDGDGRDDDEQRSRTPHSPTAMPRLGDVTVRGRNGSLDGGATGAGCADVAAWMRSMRVRNASATSCAPPRCTAAVQHLLRRFDLSPLERRHAVVQQLL